MKKITLILLTCLSLSIFSQSLNGINSTPQFSQFSLSDIFIASNPADATTYMVGSSPVVLSSNSTTGLTTVFVPCTLIGWSANFTTLVNGTTENSSLYFRLNSVDNLLTSTLQLTGATNTYSASGLSINVPSGSIFNSKIICATWATNPTSVTGNITYYFKPN